VTSQYHEEKCIYLEDSGPLRGFGAPVLRAKFGRAPGL